MINESIHAGVASPNKKLERHKAHQASPEEMLLDALS